LSSVTLFHRIFIVCHAATSITNLHHHWGLAALGKTSTPHAASQIPVVHRLAWRKTNIAHRCDTVYKFCWHLAAASGKSADPILHREPPLLKHRSDAMGEFKK
jgi:hypothetical protein